MKSCFCRLWKAFALHIRMRRSTLLVEPRSAGIGVITDVIDEVVTFDIKKRPLYGTDLIEPFDDTARR